jgi:hypothetical protein
LKMEPIGHSETSVRNYHYTLRVVQTSAILSYFASDASNHA